MSIDFDDVVLLLLCFWNYLGICLCLAGRKVSQWLCPVLGNSRKTKQFWNGSEFLMRWGFLYFHCYVTSFAQICITQSVCSVLQDFKPIFLLLSRTKSGPTNLFSKCANRRKRCSCQPTWSIGCLCPARMTSRKLIDFTLLFEAVTLSRGLFAS